MNRSKERSGFTLIEILVVLIIVGVLAAIALPNLFGNVARSKAHEALDSLSTYKTMVEACLNGNCGTEGNKCASMTFTSTTNFSYTFVPPGPANTACPTTGISAAVPGIQANGNGTQGFTTQDYIILTRAAGGTWTCTGNGKFLGVC